MLAEQAIGTKRAPLTQHPVAATDLGIARILGKCMDAFTVESLASGMNAFTVARPGLILDLPTQWRIYDALIPVTTKSFGGADLTPYWTLRMREGYLERLAAFSLVATPVGELVGWTGFHILRCDGCTVVYIDSTGMVPHQQARGTLFELVHSQLVGAAMPRCPDDAPVYLAARSENPVVYVSLSRMLLENELMYPHPGRATPREIAEIAHWVAVWLGQRTAFDEEEQVIRGAFNAVDELYAVRPTTGQIEIDQMFDRLEGPVDAYLLIGRLR